MMRRLAGFRITGEMIGMFVRRIERRIIQVESTLPPTAEFYGCYYEHDRRSFVCVFEDESFYIVHPGEPIPIVDSPVITEESIES